MNTGGATGVWGAAHHPQSLGFSIPYRSQAVPTAALRRSNGGEKALISRVPATVPLRFRRLRRRLRLGLTAIEPGGQGLPFPTGPVACRGREKFRPKNRIFRLGLKIPASSGRILGKSPTRKVSHFPWASRKCKKIHHRRWSDF